MIIADVILRVLDFKFFLGPDFRNGLTICGLTICCCDVDACIECSDGVISLIKLSVGVDWTRGLLGASEMSI